VSGKGTFDEVIHAPLRLRICGLLRSVVGLDFAILRDMLDVSDATLSKHLKALSTSGYVDTTKMASTKRDDARRVTWLFLTSLGKDAFDEHIQALRTIAAGVDLNAVT